VHGIEAASPFEQRLEAPEVRPHQTQGLAPEQPVMDNQKLNPLGNRALKGSLTTVHGESNLHYLIRAFNLEAVLRSVLNLLDP
jgi:hypothetical protein